MIFERRNQLSLPKLVVNILTMLYLLLSLFASQLFLVTPYAIKKGQVKIRGEPPFLEAKETISESRYPKTPEAPWRYGNSTLENTEHANDTCRKVDLYINFIELGLTETIVAPPGFNAYQCRGSCSLTQLKKVPNRSSLMALLEKKKGIEVAGEACCVPTKLRPISFLYMNKKYKVVLRDIDDMVVEECGCQ